MKLKKLVFTFFVLIFISNNSFCMKDKFAQINKTRGESNYESFVNCVTSKDTPESEKERIIDATMSNAIRYAFFKAKYSIEGISSKLNDVPFVGPFVSKATTGIAAALFEFDTVIKESDNIKDEAKKALIENLKKLPKEFNIDDLEDKSLRWFHEKIKIEEKEKGLFVEYLDSGIKNFAEFEKENTEACFDILCFITHFAQKNKEFFLSTVNKGFNPRVKTALSWIFAYNKICEFFHAKLSDPKNNIEGEIRGNLFPEEASKGKVHCGLKKSLSEPCNIRDLEKKV